MKKYAIKIEDFFCPLSVCLFFVLTFFFVSMGGPARAETNTYSSRTDFEPQLPTFIVDDYSNPGYFEGDYSNGSTLDVHSDEHMSSIIGETDYTSTFFDDYNVVFNQDVDPRYCAGCNGSFELGFTTTSVGGSDGVFGVGFDIDRHSANYPDPVTIVYYAFVTFGDNSTQNFAMPSSPGFFGITSDLLIKTIHFTLENGEITDQGDFVIDNLTVGGSIPIPQPPQQGMIQITFRESKKEKVRAVVVGKILDIDMTDTETNYIAKVEFSVGSLDPITLEGLIQYGSTWTDVGDDYQFTIETVDDKILAKLIVKNIERDTVVQAHVTLGTGLTDPILVEETTIEGDVMGMATDNEE